MTETRTLLPMRWDQYDLEWGLRTYIMGIVNVTPDSFSGEGLLAKTDETTLTLRAVEQALQFVAAGATFIDVGGESTRPGATFVEAAEEIARVVPVVQALRTALPSNVLISIDTYKAEVAARALEAGANVVNDVWGLQYDKDMARVVQEHGVPVILMANMRDYRKRDIISDVVRFLSRAIDDALVAGIPWEHLIIDPGYGFGTTLEEDLTLLRRLGELHTLGRPILLGTSRKKSIGYVLGGAPATERVEGTAATVALAIAQGVDIVRVHDVSVIARTVEMSDAVVRGVF